MMSDKPHIIRRGIVLVLSVLCSAAVSAQSTFGRPDYSLGAEELSKFFHALAAMMLMTLRLCSAIAAVVVIISSLQIYFKMTHGDQGVTKAIQNLFWSIIFFLAATIVFPAMFGFRFGGGSGSFTSLF